MQAWDLVRGPIIRVSLIPVVDASRDPWFLCRWAELEREALEPNPFFAPWFRATFRLLPRRLQSLRFGRRRVSR